MRGRVSAMDVCGTVYVDVVTNAHRLWVAEYGVRVNVCVNGYICVCVCVRAMKSPFPRA